MNFVTKKYLFRDKISEFRAKSDNYGTCPEIGQLRIGQLRYIYCSFMRKHQNLVPQCEKCRRLREQLED